MSVKELPNYIDSLCTIRPFRDERPQNCSLKVTAFAMSTKTKVLAIHVTQVHNLNVATTVGASASHVLYVTSSASSHSTYADQHIYCRCYSFSSTLKPLTSHTPESNLLWSIVTSAQSSTTGLEYSCYRLVNLLGSLAVKS